MTLDLLPVQSFDRLRVEGAKPRPYQAAAIEACSKFFSAGGQRGLIVHPTGVGKTVLFMFLMMAFRVRCLFIAHREELLEQTMREMRQLIEGVDVGLVKADANELRARHCLCASIQTIAMPQRLDALLASDERDPLGLLFVDEAHHASADSYLKVLDHPRLRDRRTVGLTATGERHDRRGLAKVWGPRPLHHYTYQQAVDDEYLVPYTEERITVPNYTPPSLADAMKRGVDVDQEEVAKEQERCHFAEHVADGTASAVARGRKPIVFTTTVDQAERVATILNDKHGVRAGHVSGAMSPGLRKSTLVAHRMGEIRVLTNCELLTEGYNDPSITSIGMAKVTASFVKFYQMAGRGFRIFPGKSDCLIQDYVGALDVHDLLAVRNFLDADEDGTDGAAKSDALTLCGRKGCLHARGGHRKGSGKCKAEGCSCRKYDGPGDLDRLRGFAAASAHGSKGRAKPKPLARVRWLPVADGVLALPAGERGNLILRQEEDSLWRAYRLPADAWNPGELRVLTRRAFDLSLACGVVEDHARQLGVFKLSDQKARWRGDDPSTGQVDQIIGLGLAVPLTRGEASDAITLEKLKRLFAKSGLPTSANGGKVLLP